MNIYKLEMPLTKETLIAVQSEVSKFDVLTFFDSSIDPVDASLYRIQKVEHQTRTYALLDRNVFKDIISVVSQSDQRSIEHRKFGAALTLFFQCADITVEPTLAINENSTDFLEELTLFRGVDNAESSDLLKVFMGELNHLPKTSLGNVTWETLPPSLPEKIRGHQALETAVTKIAILDHSDDCPPRKFEKFLQWSFAEFFLVREAVILALLHFSRGSESPVLKKTRSKNIDTRLRSIQNAVWDLTLARDWSRRVSNQANEKQLWLLCSRDPALQRLARRIVLIETDPDAENDYLLKMFQERFTKQSGSELHTQYLKILSNKDSMDRLSNQPNFEPYSGDILDNLQAELRIL